MGKRELLLVVGFVVAGVIVYQATASPPQPGSRGFSFGRIFAELRREIRGNPASAEVTQSSTHPVPSTVDEFRVISGFGEVTITGEQREDIAIDMRIVSDGPDEAEARRWASEVKLKVDATANSIAFKVDYPEQGRQRGYFDVKVPARLAVRLDQTSSRASVTNVASVEMLTARGETTVKRIRGRVAMSHIGGPLVVEDVGALKLTGRRTDATLTQIRGDLALDLQNSEVTASRVTGPVSVEARSSEVTFNRLDQARGPFRVNAIGGTVALRDLAAESRVDGRNTEVDVELAKPAPVTIYNEGDEPIDVTPAAGGYTLDALATHARISLPEGVLSVAEGESEQRASGPVNGGGPAITLRANRGNINIRSR